MAIETPREIDLAHGELHALISTTGAQLRSFSVAGEPVLWGTAPSEIVTDGRGQVLAPWPNRLQDGAFSFGGHDVQVPWNEPAKHNAIHGLVRWLAWSVTEQTAAGVQLTCPLAPQSAYPFDLALTVTYQLSSAGLAVTVRAHNSGHESLPFGIGFHPYFHPGPHGIATARLQVPAASHLLADVNGIPVGRETLAGTPDWQPLGQTVLDDCYGGLIADHDGRWRVRFSPAGARPVAVVGDGAFGYVMCFTADTLAGANRRAAVAIEPMTCPANALRSGADLIVLDPDEHFVAGWGIEI